MKTTPHWRPHNVIPFRLCGLAVNALDQELMATLSRIASRRGSTVADLIYDHIEEWVAECEAETELEMKIIKFPS